MHRGVLMALAKILQLCEMSETYCRVPETKVEPTKTPTKDQALEGTILISQNIPETNINNYHWYHLTSLFKKHGNSKAFVSIGPDGPRS